MPSVKAKDYQATIAALKEAFSRGLTIKLACDYAGISERTFYRYMETERVAKAINFVRAEYAAKLTGKVEKKDPWKLLKSLYRGEYIEDPSTLIQINNIRPLQTVPTKQLLEVLKLPIKKDDSDTGSHQSE